jgi:type IV secretion system protein VirB3
MADDTENDDTSLGDVLYVAITRPAMKMGVPVEGLFVNGTITYFAFIWSSHGGTHLLRMLLMLLIFPIIHLPMRVLAAIDHNMFRIGRLWLQRGISFYTHAWEGELLPSLPHRLPTAARNVSGSV